MVEIGTETRFGQHGERLAGHVMGLFKTIALVGVVGLAGIGAGLGAHALMRAQTPAPPVEMLPFTAGSLRLVVPSTYARGGAAGGNRINLVLRHPDMSAAVTAPPDAQNLVFVSIMPSDGEMDPAQRVQDLYGRFLEPDTWQNPGGLLLRRFQAGSPYDDEELYIAPPDGRDFNARCRKKVRGLDRQSELVGEACLWRFRREGADIQVRFAPEMLPDWEALSNGVKGRLDRWARAPAAQ